ncbi:restriction endonuclease [Halalkalibacter akibai]|uniref:Putative tellurium resistance protein n=1 Tax=Halalkalibacter akibai (strain ATCC 43226 / DSM 21942 / CIP 109018 / JCM 9157 / 1139) TaxID=1236973 RepID=W4QWK2_HALA3|nr:restriction endonuclease [Halalkalibacter akibai]GAE36461.1 putative tellurium resistance protein [Halalkalibacter akibai JCM 9157]
MIEKQISNRYLNESKVLKAKTSYELEKKINKQRKQWKEKEKVGRLKDESLKKTQHAISSIEKYRSILTDSLNVNHTINCDDFYDHSTFNKVEPSLETYITEVDVPKEDKFFEFLFSSIKRKREEKLRVAENLYREAIAEFHNERNIFLNEQTKRNKEITSFKQGFANSETISVERYFKLVLDNSIYPECFKKDFDIQYNRENKTLIIEYSLPHSDNVPNIVEYKFIQTRKDVDIKRMKKKEFETYYDDILYQITLRTIHECFSSDSPENLETVAFNGWMKGIDTATGQEFNSRIISIHVKKDEFSSLNLGRVVPKDCFRNLKGISAGPLYLFSPIRPIIAMDKYDKRFIESKEILANINSIPNIATMDWNDFEHLIGQLFELYFKKIGGEVKVTRATREGGIDAVIFDPDPIRGGKFIIQAKRYNAVVPPEAVRALNGVMNDEGASKGILVTTAYFGPDSWTFVKNKPITLIDGPRLVHMLDEHGHRVRCEINKGKKEPS